MAQADLMYWNQHEWRNQLFLGIYRYLKMLDFNYANLSHANFSQTKKTQKNTYLHKQFQPTVHSVVIIPLLPVHRTIENFSVELMLLLLLCSSISFRHTTHRRFCLGSLSTISLYHAKYVILTLMLATPYALVCSPCAGMIVVGLWSLKFGVY